MRLGLALALCLCLLPRLALAGSADCAALATQAGMDEGLPPGLLPAIAMVESGHTDRDGTRAPWPWTLNQGGKSMFFDSRDQALAYLQQAVAQGVTNIDVGCMQLNWKWHSAAFASADQMFDPVANTRYAARFLRELKSRLGSWEVATAAYHSTDPERGRDYLQKVVAAQGDLPATPGQPKVVLALAPMQLDGILAFSGAPLVQLEAARAAAADMAATGTATAQLPPLAGARRPPPRPEAHAAPPPDLPMVEAALRAPLTEAANLPPALQRDWDEVLAMRRLLHNQP